MKQILISSTLLWNLSLCDMFRQVYELGLGGLEMWAQHFYCRQYDEGEYRRLSQKYPLQTVVHSCSWDLNLSSMNQAVRQASVEEVIASMEFAKRVGAREVTVHPGHMTMPCWRRESALLMHESLQKIADASYRLNMPVSLEIMEKTKKEFVTDIESMKEVTGDLFSFFTYTLDIAHCDSPDEGLDILRRVDTVSKLHISNRIGGLYHTPLYDGDFDFTELLPALRSYHLPMVLEGYDPQGGLDVFYRNVEFLQEHLMQLQCRIS